MKKKKEMLINVLQSEEIRIAILEDGVLEELYVERTSHESYVGNIYKGKIVNIEPSIQAAFVDFGVGRNGFLHVSDVQPIYSQLNERGGPPDPRGDSRETREPRPEARGEPRPDDRGGRGRDDRAPRGRDDRGGRGNDRGGRGRDDRGGRGNDRGGRGRDDRGGRGDSRAQPPMRVYGENTEDMRVVDQPPAESGVEDAVEIERATFDYEPTTGPVLALPPSDPGVEFIVEEIMEDDDAPLPMPASSSSWESEESNGESVGENIGEPQPLPVETKLARPETFDAEVIEAEVVDSKEHYLSGEETPRWEAPEPEPKPEAPVEHAEAAQTEAAHVEAAPVEPAAPTEAAATEEVEEPKKGRRTTRKPAAKKTAEKAEKPTEKAEKPKARRTRKKVDGDSQSEATAGDDDKPQPMESSERRTDEHDPSMGPLEPRPIDLSDDDLSFSAPPPPPPRPAARQEPRHVEPPRQVEPPRHVEAPRHVEPEPAYEEPTTHYEEVEEQVEQRLESDDEPAPTYQQQSPPGFEAFEDDFGGFGEFDAPGEVPNGGQDRGRGGDRGGDRGGRPSGRRDDRGGRGGDRGGRPGGRRDDRGRPGGFRPRPLIQDIFKRGQEVLVQVIKEGIGTKGPTLSTYISIAGRYLVLMPGLSRVGVSRKIEDDQVRRRLRDHLNSLNPPTHKGLGFIIRTAGESQTRTELQRDLGYLCRLWEVIVRRMKRKTAGELYQESDMVTRTIRDIFTSDIDTIWVDEPAAYEQAKEFLQVVMPDFADRIKLWESPEPMFHKHGIEQEINRIQQRKVPLPLGGSIVVDQTEALVAIDVNSGNFRADNNNAEESAYQMNLQAAKEIARQLRLRDLGGVIVNDFIDMREERHRRGVERALRDAVERDRARTKILRMSQFGIIEMTRQRIRPSLKRSAYQECGHCKGTSHVKTAESMGIDVIRLLQLAAARDPLHRIEVRVHAEVAQYLANRKRKEIAQLEETRGKQISVFTVDHVSPEHLEFVCYDNNNHEVKFSPFEEPRLPPRRRNDR
jgi:ribonuclease E